MVLGQYSSNMGTGKRVTFPRKFSAVLGTKLLITKGLDGNLIMVASSQQELLLEGIETKPYVPEAMRERQAFVLGNTFEVELDRLNRFVIPPSLYHYAEIGTEVVFTGIGDFVAVWDRRRWETYQIQLQQSMGKRYEDLPGNE